MIYLGVLAVLFILSFAVDNRSVFRLQIYYLTIAILFLFSAFRYEVGCDWLSYYVEYQVAESLNWSSIPALRQPIWWAILRGMHELGWPYLLANVISSAAFFVGVHILARRQPDPLGFLVLLFPILIINMPMSGIRQGAAIGLICIAFVLFMDRRPILFGLWVILAAGFHTSALIFLLLLPFVTESYSRRRILAGAFLALPGAYSLALTGTAGQAISIYVGTDIQSSGAAFRVGLLTLTALYFLGFLRQNWRAGWPKDYPIASLGSIAMIVVTILLPLSSVIADRLAYYLVPIQALIISRMPFVRPQGGLKIGVWFPYAVLFLVLSVWTQTSLHFQECYSPYKSWIIGLPSFDVYGFSRP